MNTILFTAVCLIGIVGISLLVTLPAGIPGRRRTLAALERAESGETTLSDLTELIHGHAHPVFFMLRGYTARIEAQCVRLIDELGVPGEDFGWGAGRDSLEVFRR